MSQSQTPQVYLLNLQPDNVGVTVSGLTPTEVTIGGQTYTEFVSNGQTASYVMSPYAYVDISYLISSCNDGVQIYAPQAGIPQSDFEGFCGSQTVTLIIQNGSVNIEFDTPQNILKSYLYNNILQNMNTDLSNVYQELLALISEYASGQSLSQSALSSVSSALQDLNNMLQKALQFEARASLNFEGVSALQEVYNNLVQIYDSLTSNSLTVDELQSLQLPSYSTPEASAIASSYSQFLNEAINIMQNASSQSSQSSSQQPTPTGTTTTPPSSSQGSSSTSSTTSQQSSSTSSSTPSSSSSSQSSSSSSPSSSSSSSSNSTSPTTGSQSSTQSSSSSSQSPPEASSQSSQSSSQQPTPTGTTTTPTPPSTPTPSPPSPIASPTPSTTPPTLSQGQVLAQIRAGDISALLSGTSEIPQNMIPLVNAVIQLYQLYGVPDGTPLSSVVERLLSDIREAYYKISNHQQEEVNTQQLTQLLQIYNTLASNNLAPPSQSASKLSTLVQTSGIMPALPAVLGQYYPGRVYSNYV